jgi:hypothetical protein
VDEHAGLQGVTADENGLFLYKSSEVLYAGSERFTDYWALALLLGVSSGHWLCILPLVTLAMRTPRQLVQTKYFTIHAELIPQTEQVLLHKASLFGNITRYYVDIQSLEKIEAEELDMELLWVNNKYDDKMIFKDSYSGEVFVFDKEGIWNKDTLEHPLLN